MFEKCIYFNLVTLTRKITRTWQEAFEPFGLAPSHGYLLFAVAEKAANSQKDLSDLLELDASTVNRFVDLLIRKGLLEKDRAGKGGLIQVTPEGQKVYRKISKTMDKLYNSMQNHFGKAVFKAFVEELFAARISFEGGRE